MREAVPRAIDVALTRALAKVPADRFATGHDFAEALLATRAVSLARPSRRTTRALAGILLIVFLAVGIVFVTDGSRGLSRKRVVVTVLENRTGDPSHDGAGRAATDWIVQGLIRTGFVDEVLTTSVLLALAEGFESEAGVPNETQILRMARSVGIGTVIWGGYDILGDSLDFYATISDVKSASVVENIGPVRGSSAEPRSAIDNLEEQILGLLAGRFDPLLSPESWNETSLRPPTLAAFHAFEEARIHIGRGNMQGAARRAGDAAGLDSTFGRAFYLSAVARMNLGQWAQVDSLVRVWNASREHMTQVDRHNLDAIRDHAAGNLRAALTSAREAALLAPNAGPHLHAGFLAMLNNRYELVLQIYDTADLDLPFWRNMSYHWFYLTEAYHGLHRHRRELREANRALDQHPEMLVVRYLEMRALAARGKVNEVLALVEQISTLTPHGGYPPDLEWTPGLVMTHTAQELSAHGYADAAQQVLARAITWFEQRPASEAEIESHRFRFAGTLYLSQRWTRADSAFQELVTDFGDSVSYHGYLGALAARRGDREEAERISGWLDNLDRQYLFGEHNYARARIAALLGNQESAVDFLRLAFSQGFPYSLHIHMDPDLVSLAGYQPFEELMKPKR